MPSATWSLFCLAAFCSRVSESSSRCSSAHGGCSRYHCDTEFVHHSAEDFIAGAHSSVFTQPCSCLEGWNEDFCLQQSAKLHTLLRDLVFSPVLCVCRKFADNGFNCNQFISRCFKRDNQECHCCFSQPAEHCNQIECVHGEPKFSNSNTSCVCFTNSADYPTQLCRDFNFSRFQLPKSLRVRILGVDVSTTLILGVVVVLLVAVALLTTAVLIVGNRRLQRRKEERNVEMTLASDSFVAQRNEEETCLASV